MVLNPGWNPVPEPLGNRALSAENIRFFGVELRGCNKAVKRLSSNNMSNLVTCFILHSHL